MQSFDAWRSELEAENKGRSWDALVTTTDGGVRVEPLVASAPSSTLPARSTVHTGAVLGAGERAPAGPSLAWWRGRPGAASPSTRLAVVESDEAVTAPEVPLVVVGRAAPSGARRADPAGLAAAERGAGPIAELAAALVPLVQALEAGEPASRLAVALTVSPEFFVELAKLRAARRAIAGLVHAAGQQAAVPLVVRGKVRAQAGLDAETNAVRSTLAAAAGLVGGADAVASLPFDDGPLAARLSWTEGEVLVRESHLHRFDDAAEGAPFVEALTEQLGTAAWDLCRAELRAPGALADRIAADAEARERAVRSRIRPLVGVSRFAAAGAALSGGDAAPFERLRAATPAGTRAAVVWLGDAKLAARVEFAREALELLGATVAVTRPLASVDEAAQVEADVAVIAAADGDFDGPVVALAEMLARRGVRVAVAGKPKDAEGPLRAAGVRSFLFLGGDVVSALEALIGGGS